MAEDRPVSGFARPRGADRQMGRGGEGHARPARAEADDPRFNPWVTGGGIQPLARPTGNSCVPAASWITQRRHVALLEHLERLDGAVPAGWRRQRWLE